MRQQLLTAAAELIPERGWTAVSTRVLAERAGVSPSVVHYHFPSLPALLNEAVIGVIRRVVGEVEALLTDAGTPAEAVEAMVAAVEQYTGTDPVSLLSIEAYLAATRDESLRDEIAGEVERFRHRLARWLGERGVVWPDETAAVLVAALDGLLLHRGLGTRAAAGTSAAVLRRLVEQT